MRFILVHIVIRLDPRGPAYMMIFEFSKLAVSLLVPGPHGGAPTDDPCPWEAPHVGGHAHHEHELTWVDKFSRSVNPLGYATILTLNQVVWN